MNERATSLTHRPAVTAAELRVGLRSLPYLADHGFQDMVVLPGSYYVETAMRLDRGLSRCNAGIVRNIAFHHPIIVSTEDVVITVDVADLGNGRVEYTFYEAGIGDRAGSGVPRYAARLEIDRSEPAALRAGENPLSIETFQTQARSVIDSEQFYKKLRENGNQYGPYFQKVSTIWRAGDQSLGNLMARRQDQDPETHLFHPSVLDAALHLLAPFMTELGKTFVLRSIGKVEAAGGNLPEELWVHATRMGDGDERRLHGDIRVFDAWGKPYFEITGIAFDLLDRQEAPSEPARATLVVAANFTAEPIEDCLNFWADHFDLRIRAEFAPYNQIFQQLLSAGSAFLKNRDGINVVLLDLEEWTKGERPTLPSLDPERAQQCFGTLARHVLPNGLQMAHLNQYETDYLYKEIFEDLCYLRHGIRLRDGDTVVDIGANIGLFSLFVMSRCANPRIFAFEPAPVVHEILRANCDAYGSNVCVLNLGVSDRPKTATFTYYEKSSVFSGFYSDEAEDRGAIQAVVRNLLQRESVGGESVDDYIRELTADRLNGRTCECRLTTVSEIIRDNRIDRIDLLKIDAEKSELDIIRGIEDHDWPKIKQIVIEIHDRTGDAVRRIEELLAGRGFHCAVEQEALLDRAGFFNLYATRDDSAAEGHAAASAVEPSGIGDGKAERAASSLKRNIGDLCSALRSFMKQDSAPLVLCVCPRTPAAKANPDLTAVLNGAEEALLAEAGKIAKVHALGSESILRRYPVEDYYDPHSHHAGHVPYTPGGYAAIGTALIRAVYNLKRSPSKVIVLDCDNTLWKGVCGEDGPLGVQVTAPFRALQQFVVGRMNSGMLLCLCSKNNEKDALDVFDQRNDMLLKREHLVSWRINWNSKSENIKSLAKELNLGLDSFIFIDDNPVDCADVRINCPGVLTLQLPQNDELIPGFLANIWAFDHAGSTKEDRNRTRMYQESSNRERYRGQSLSLKDFVKGLELRVEIAEPAEGQIDRVSQLTLRTNQFNFTTVRRSKSEIRSLLAREDAKCLVVRVVDRFGDYGLVGVLIYEVRADRYTVDTFLLSCRVLGRGVEHAVVSRLGRQAVEEGKRFVEFAYSRTVKNLPALEFMRSIGDRYQNEAGNSWVFPAGDLAAMEYDPHEGSPVEVEAEDAGGPEQAAARSPLAFDGANRSEQMQRLGENLYDVERILAGIESHRVKEQPLPAGGDAGAGSSLEAALVGIWRRVLGRPRIGLNDNFFEAGGTSLRAVQVIAAIKKELNHTLSIVSLFECPTVKLLAARLAATSEEAKAGITTAAAVLRGQQRRYGAQRQKAS